MKSSSKGLVCAGLLAGLAGLTGCGGFSGSPGVAPINFLMPGVMNRPCAPSTPETMASKSKGGSDFNSLAAAPVLPAVPVNQEKPIASIASSTDL